MPEEQDPQRESVAEINPLPVGSISLSVELEAGQPGPRAVTLLDHARKILLSRYSPAAVILDADFRIRYYLGSTEHFLRAPVGMPSEYLFHQCREGLNGKLRAMLLDDRAGAERAIHAHHQFYDGDGVLRCVRISVQPLAVGDAGSEMTLVVFEERPNNTPNIPGDSEDGRLLKQLTADLDAARRESRFAQGEFIAVSELLHKANEEIDTIKEELQCANEELETSRESLRAYNEHLGSLNEQLSFRLEEVEHLNDDLSSLFASLEIATLFLDAEGHVLRFSSPTRKLFRLVQRDVGRHINDISSSFPELDLWQEVRPVMEEFAAKCLQIQSESGRWYRLQVAPYLARKRILKGVIVTFQDITELKQKSESLKLLEVALENFQDPVAVVDFDGTIKDWNRAAEWAYGWSRKEALGTAICDYICEWERVRFNSGLQAVCEGKPVESLELHRLKRDGRLLPVRMCLNAVADSNDQLAAVIISERDQTTLYQSENELRRAKLEAERANFRKSRFLSSVGHDLRQPLQSLQLLNATLGSRIENKDLSDLLRHQEAALKVMSGMLNTLTDINRIEAGEQVLEVSDFDAALLFSQLREKYIFPAQRKGLRLQINPIEGKLHSDFNLLSRILSNLVENAIKYTDHGEISITGEPRGTVFRIEVKDTGRGIATDQQRLIFNDFYQVDNDARDSERGSGLGLSICRLLAEQLGTRIELQSEPGVGSVFALEIEIPRATPSDREESTPVNVAGESERDPGRQVLLVENDRVVAHGIREFLDFAGFRVHHTTTAEAAIAYLHDCEVPPGLLISDYRLSSSMNGLELLDLVHKQVDKDLPAILLTGDTMGVQQPLIKPNCRLMYKPVDAQQLRAAIHDLTGY